MLNINVMPGLVKLNTIFQSKHPILWMIFQKGHLQPKRDVLLDSHVQIKLIMIQCCSVLNTIPVSLRILGLNQVHTKPRLHNCQKLNLLNNNLLKRRRQHSGKRKKSLHRQLRCKLFLKNP